MYRTPEEIARELHVSRRTVYEWLRSGRLRGVRAGRGWRVRPEDVASFLEANSLDEASVTAVPSSVEADPPGGPLSAQEYLALPPEELAKRHQAVMEVLDSFMEEDEEEQRETWEALKKALDEDRLSYRKLFP